MILSTSAIGVHGGPGVRHPAAPLNHSNMKIPRKLKKEIKKRIIEDQRKKGYEVKSKHIRIYGLACFHSASAHPVRALKKDLEQGNLKYLNYKILEYKTIVT